MDIGTISLVLMLGLIGLLAIGMPLGMASSILAVLVLVMKFEPTLLWAPWTFGEGILTGRPGTGPLYLLAQKIYGLLTDYVLISIPLFIFMASLLERSGIARDMYSSLNVWLNRTRGGIAIVTSIMAVIMAAMSGIIGGEVVLLGLIALPQMLRLGYNQNLAIGTICASGSLGTMIPPSIVLIIYGLVTETSIKALFTAAFIPGFMLASFIIIYIIIRTQLHPEDAPLPEPVPGEPQGAEKRMLFVAFLNVLLGGFSLLLFLRALFFSLTGQSADLGDGADPIFLGGAHLVPWLGGIAVLSVLLALFVFGRGRTAEGWRMGKGLVAPILVIGVVLGSIYGGITGITEAAGMGAITVFILAVFRGEASWDLVWDSLMRTLKSTGTIIWVTIGAAALAGAYTVAGGPRFVADLIVGSEMPTMLILLTMMLILLFMGAFMDWVGIVLLIIPVFLPIVQRLPIEEIGLLGALTPSHLAIWFGVLFCVNMQVSFLSPPFGPAAFYLKSVAPPHITLPDIFRGFLPFICIQILVLMLILLFPELTMILQGEGDMLSADRIEAFRTDGYLVVEDVLDQATVLDPVRAEYAALLDGLYAGWQAEGRVPPGDGLSFGEKLVTAYRAGCEWFQPMDISLPGDRIAPDTPMHFGPAVFDMIRNPRLLDLVECLIGPEITSNPIQHVRIKPPRTDLRDGEIRAHIAGTDWHQDRGVALEEADATEMVTVWIAVTDATVENGCLQVMPRRVADGMLPHCPKRQTAIADGFIDEAAALPLPVRSGGVVVFHPLAPHASLENVSDGIRWSFDIRFSRSGQPTGRAHFPDFVARSRSRPETELRDWRAWRQMWEDARARLAVAPHVDIHRWQSDAPYCA